MGLTISDAVRILLTRVAKEGALPMAFATDPTAYDAWFRTKVQEALDDRVRQSRTKKSKLISPNGAATALRKVGDGDK